MAVCESSQLESGLARIKRDESDDTSEERPLPAGLPLTVDYRSPVSHFVPPAVELYAARQKQEQVSSAESSETTTPIKRKRGRPRVDKTSPEYQANLAARKQAREMAAMMNADRTPEVPPSGKRKRGRPRIDKTSPEYLARKHAREMEALERKVKKEYKRRGTAVKTTAKVKPPHRQTQPRGSKKLPVKNVRKLPQMSGKVAAKITPRKISEAHRKLIMRRNTKLVRVKRKDSGASSSTGDTTPRVKRKYTKRTPGAKKNDGTPQTEKVKGKRGRPRKDQLQNRQAQAGQIRVRSNLMPPNNEPISLDSDEEPDLGSPGAASDSLSLDENLRALRHIHEKYANIDKDEMFEAHLLAANFKKPPVDGVQRNMDDEVTVVRSSDGTSRFRREENNDRVEKLEDSSNSDSDSSSSGSGSSSSGSSSSSSSGSDSSDSSDSESDTPRTETETFNSTYPTPPWARTPHPLALASGSGSDSEPDPERAASPAAAGSHDDISESDNESPDKSYQCHICKKWYSTRVTLKIHRRSHQNRGTGTTRTRTRYADRYECDMCNETFPRREKLFTHKSEAHRGSMTFRCSVCQRCFEHDDELTAHKAQHTHHELTGRCSQCNSTFETWEQLKRHVATAHSPPRAASPGGGGGSAGAGGGGGGAHSCSHCGKRFTHVHSLTRHLQNHAKQLYRCVVCKASFARADQLAQHLNSHLDNYKRLKP